jgi:hypothetical protein
MYTPIEEKKEAKCSSANNSAYSCWEACLNLINH